jgi:hypothetical protein
VRSDVENLFQLSKPNLQLISCVVPHGKSVARHLGITATYGSFVKCP